MNTTSLWSSLKDIELKRQQELLRINVFTPEETKEFLLYDVPALINIAQGVLSTVDKGIEALR